MRNNVCIENRKAKYNYFIEETLECGIELLGNEIKSIRLGQATIVDSWVSLDNGELFIKKMHVTPWSTANRYDIDEDRDKKLLAHKSEIRSLENKLQNAGYTLIPLKVYVNNDGRCKVLIGLAKGKHNYDKRQTLKENQMNRDIERALKNR